MDRRAFLSGGAAVILGAAQARAQMKMDAMPGMAGMSHGNPTRQATAVKLPEGRPLADLPRLKNASTEAGLFKASISAAPGEASFLDGVRTPVLSYNTAGPGLLIEATEGDWVEIDFQNRIPSEISTIHWHGLPVPADQDGNPMDPVASGASRLYRFPLPAGSAGTYWYHPHPHELTAEQVYRGLAGAFIVKPRIDPVPAAFGDTPLFFIDLRIDADGKMPASTMADMMNGRVGDHVLVNGGKNPVLSLATGTSRRFRLFNATNARYLRLSFSDLEMTLIGTDGGLLEAPVTGLRELLLGPAERAEIVVSFPRQGSYELATLEYDRGWMGPGKPPSGVQSLLTVKAEPSSAEPMPRLPERLRPIEGLGSPKVRRSFVFGENMSMSKSGMKMEFMINGRSFDMKRIDVIAKQGETELWEIRNPTDMDHPFHVHGTQFQVVEIEKAGQITPAAYRAWKDTINVARGESVRILLRQDQLGPRMYHCHILEHEQLGMMGVLDVRA